MTHTPPRTPAPAELAPPTRKSPVPLQLDHMRALRTLLPGEQILLRTIEFSEGDELLSHNAQPEHCMAFFVLEGTLNERQTRLTREHGWVTQTCFPVGPGSIAFAQALIAPYNKQPALTSIIAASNGTAVFLTSMDDLPISDAERLLLMNEFRLRLFNLQSSTESNIATDLDAEVQQIVSLYVRQGVKKTGREILRELAEGLQRSRMLSQRIAELEEANARLKTEKAGAENHAREAREAMQTSVVALEHEREQLMWLGNSMSKGFEKYFERVSNFLRAAKIDPSIIALTADERALFLGSDLPVFVDTDLDAALSFAQGDVEELDSSVLEEITP